MTSTSWNAEIVALVVFSPDLWRIAAGAGNGPASANRGGAAKNVLADNAAALE